MHRFYADPDLSDESCFVLTPDDTHHAQKVLRLKPGDHVEIFFRGMRFLSVVNPSDQTALMLSPVSVLPTTEPSLSVTLFQGLPKSDKMDFIVQKAVELGAVKIVPVAFSRSVVRLNQAESLRKQERWQKIAREAGKQSGRCIIPEVLYPVSVSSLPEYFHCCEHTVVPWEECEKGGPLSFVKRYPALSSLGIIIGPEGGITGDEIDLFLRSGCETLTLGKRILRTETAGLAALSVFFGLYGEMEL